MNIFTQKLIRTVDEASTLRTFHFEAPENYHWIEGSHLHLAFVDYDLTKGRNPHKIRHMSIASLPEEGTIAITTRLTGDSPFKIELSRLRPGDAMQLFDISSRLHLRRLDRPLVLLSNGVGLAAFRPLILKYLAEPARIPSLHSLCVAPPDGRIYEKELAGLNNGSFSHTFLTHRGPFREALGKPLFKGSLYYLAGSELFLRDTVRSLRLLGVPDRDIIIDKKPPVREMFFKTLDLLADTPFAFR